MKSFVGKFLSLVLSCYCVLSAVACRGKECAHSYTSVTTKQATCKETGIKTYTCTICGNSYMEDIEKTTEHSYTNAVTKEATCKEIGVKTYTCKICQDIYTEEIEVDPYAHRGKYECSICYKNYNDCVYEYVKEHGEERDYTADSKYYYLSYDYYSEDNHYRLQITVRSSRVQFFLFGNHVSTIGIWTKNFGENDNLIEMNNELYELNPEIVTPTLNILFDSTDAAKNIKILLDAMNRFFMVKNLQIGTRDFGYINYPSNGD